MKLANPDADVFVPDGAPLAEALARTTHMGIGAHQDDLEIFAYHGIAACYRQPDQWFAGVTVTNGAGSSRTGPYAGFTDRQMREARRREQRAAAAVGEYGAQLQLDYPSAAVKEPSETRSVEDLAALLDAARPHTLYLHNPADKHDTHVAVLHKSVQALRRLPKQARPRRLYGCEVWRGLDWLPDERKVALDVSQRPSLAQALVSLFDSQIAGGKRYDLAAPGRWRANATYFEPRASDAAEGVVYAIDLAPLRDDDSLDLDSLVQPLLRAFVSDVGNRIRKFRSA